MKEKVTAFVDILYPLFRRFMPLYTYRYAICGGFNTVLGFSIYYIAYHFVFNRSVLDLGFFAFKPHMAALFLSASISFIMGFILNKYVVFTGSNLRGRIQLFRYGLTFSANVLLNYFLLKLMVEYLSWNVIISQVLNIVIVTLFSYFGQKYFSFRGHAGSK